ncbi:lamin tail domain-containing protein [Polyangium sp. y55x31]|uniref:lamin tail domain-containing protein n=1 Tax=Polyangium sp. y55x31 TaxID=3042688 RepID=UPI002482826E|nr:lamin tail domain-containing protein [Polyangium sp. y55x31]MDI1477752.1 lamin tail domain-containing protein [Polyangium sp. y55x31]
MQKVACPLLALALALVACRPDLPMPEAGLAPATQTAGITVAFEPEAPVTAAPRVLRVHVAGGPSLDEARLFLVRGEVRDSHLRQIERDDVSKALAERFVPTLRWRADDGAVVLAPTVPLDPGETYVVASGEPRASLAFVAEPAEAAPLLVRAWPPADAAGAGLFGLYCGDMTLPEVSFEATLAPDGPLGAFGRGVASAGAGGACLRFMGRGLDAEGGPWVPPPVVWLPGLPWPLRVDPRPFGGAAPGDLGEAIEGSLEGATLECTAFEVPFGPGCVEVEDDRLLGRAPAAAMLWGIAGEGLDVVMTTQKNERFVLKGLPAAKAISLDVTTIDLDGRQRRVTFSATTLTPMPHVVLNEVMANPLGPEPDQEWVELYNDGSVEAALDELVISDIGGETVLPEIMLPPRGFAVIVNETFVVDDEIDVPPAEDALLVRVPELGKNGLGNGGEIVRLRDMRGRTISRFPAIPKPKAGQSVVRRSPDAPDGVSDSFQLAPPTPGAANTASFP